jgi:hypothetical protein
MYFVSEHRNIIFLPIDGIDLQAHSVNTQNNNTVVLTAARTPSVTVYNYEYYFYRNTNFVRSLEVYDDGTTHSVKMFFPFNLINYLVVITIKMFQKLVLFTSSGESSAQTYFFWNPDWATFKPGPGGPTSTYDLSKTLAMYEVQKKLTELLPR